jgi:hypothetical protein
MPAMQAWHVAALALLGWYLIVPPMTGLGGGPDLQAPFNKWHIRASFDSARACNHVYLEELDRIWKSKADAKQRIQIQNAQCIATDDPRLKGN